MFSVRTSFRISLSYSLKLTLSYAGIFICTTLAIFYITFFMMREVMLEQERQVLDARMEELKTVYKHGGIEGLDASIKAYAAPQYAPIWSELSRYGINPSPTRSHDDLDTIFIRLVGSKKVLIRLPYGRVKFYDAAKLPPGEGTRTGIGPEWPNRMGISLEGPDLVNANELVQIPPTLSGLYSLRTNDGSERLWFLVSEVMPDGNVLQIGKENIQTESFVANYKYVFMRSIVPIVAIGVLLGWLLTFRSLQPLRNVIKTLGSILRTGDSSQRVEVPNHRDELGELSKLFNQVLERNDSLMKRMRESLDNVAHDLRTPLARMRGVAELSLQEPDDQEALLDALGTCMEESDDVITQLNTMMDVAEAEAGVMDLKLAEVDAAALLNRVADLYEFVAEDAGVAIVIEARENVSVIADEARLRRCLANLVDNAVKYNHSGGNVWLRTGQSDDGAYVEIADDGRGISEEDCDFIWDRLYRADDSRTSKGLGLGLSFVKAIVELHGGRVDLQGREGGGTCFRLILPGRS